MVARLNVKSVIFVLLRFMIALLGPIVRWIKRLLCCDIKSIRYLTKIYLKKMVMGRVAISTAVGMAAAGYCTYRYIQSLKKNDIDSSQNFPLKNEANSNYSSSGSFYTASEYLSDVEYFDALEQGQDSTEEDQLFEKVDKLMEADESGIECAYLEMEKYYEDMSECPNFLWRYAKVHHLKGKVGKDKAQELNEKGLKYAERAVRQDPNNPEAHKWFAILIGREAEFISNQQNKIEKAKIFIEHIQEALKLSPEDWELHHLLGVFEYKLADLSFIEKRIARFVFGGIASCEYWVAKNHFQIAEGLNPKSSKETKLFLAKCFYAEKNFEQALKWLNKALEIKVKSIDDKACHKEANKLKYEYTKNV